MNYRHAGVLLLTSGLVYGEPRVAPGLSFVFKDLIHLLGELWAPETAKIALLTTPFIVGTKPLDERIHNRLYCAKGHKNLCTWPHWIHQSANIGTGIILSALGLPAIGWAFGITDRRLTQTICASQVFVAGLPLTYGLKVLLKQIPFSESLRPLNGNFCKRHRVYGGWPSGHMLQLTYATTLFGSALGPAWGIPLGLMTSWVGVSFVANNRHMISQLCAGIALGALCGSAAYRVFTERFERLSSPLQCDMLIGQRGAVACHITYTF